MADDYRNFLFEHYLSIVDRYQPDLFIFENVPGILSAAPHGKKVSEIIPKEFSRKGYEITRDLKVAVVNAADYNVPQNRKRVILVGVRRKSFEGIDIQKCWKSSIFRYCPHTRERKKDSQRCYRWSSKT